MTNMSDPHESRGSASSSSSGTSNALGNFSASFDVSVLMMASRGMVKSVVSCGTSFIATAMIQFQGSRWKEYSWRTNASASISGPEVLDLKQVISKLATDRFEPR